jgi:D-alanine-D-alanine ligase
MKVIAIIMGGYSSEYEISLKSGQVVYEHLDKKLYRPYRVHIFKHKWVALDAQGKEYPIQKDDFSTYINGESIQFDCVFNAIHGSPGEDGYMQGYLELLGIPHTSCSMYQAALTFNKRDLLASLKPYGIQSAANFYVNKGDTIEESEIIAKLGLPCFVKANRAGSSFGITKVYRSEDLKPALDTAFKEDDEVIIEAFLDGTEVSVGVISYGGQITVLPITEIVSDNDFFDYQAKYMGASQEITPARIPQEWAQSVSEIALHIYKILGLSGFSRSEFIFNDGYPYLLEVNTVPGLTAESILPQQAAAMGISLEALFGNAIEEALRK